MPLEDGAMSVVCCSVENGIQMLDVRIRKQGADVQRRLERLEAELPTALASVGESKDQAGKDE